MTWGFEAADIVACAMRPEASWAHLGTLVAFVVGAWFVLRRGDDDPSRSR